MKAYGDGGLAPQISYLGLQINLLRPTGYVMHQQV